MSTRSLHEDGVRLANAIGRRGGERPFVLGLAPGGVALAARVARALLAPLDVLVARALPAAADGPVVAALAEGGAMVVDDAALAALHLTIGDLDPDVARARADLDATAARIRGERPLPALAGRTVVLVDDGLPGEASALVARAAVAAALARRAYDVVIATPLCATEARAALALHGHDVVALDVAPAAEVAARLAHRGGPRPPDEREMHAIVARALRDVGADPVATAAIAGR